MNKDGESNIFTRLNKFLSERKSSDLTKRDKLWLDKAYKLSLTSERNIFKLGSIIVQNNKNVGSGVNSPKTHPLQSKWNEHSDCLHAEISAIINSGIKDYSNLKATIYVARAARKDLAPACSYPCVNCWAFLDFIGIKNIVCYDEGGSPVKIKVK